MRWREVQRSPHDEFQGGIEQVVNISEESRNSGHYAPYPVTSAGLLETWLNEGSLKEDRLHDTSGAIRGHHIRGDDAAGETQSCISSSSRGNLCA